MMGEEIKDYIFYMITKQDDCLKTKGYCFGVIRGKSCLDHSEYFYRLRDIDPYLFEGISYSYDWTESAEEIVKSGNILIANTAIEIERVEDRLYVICLPSFPTLYQINELYRHMDEFEKIDISIDLYGEDRSYFLEAIQKSDYKSLNFLKGYLKFHKKRLDNLNKDPQLDYEPVQKVMC